MTHLLSDARVVEASLDAVPAGITIGCTCRWDEHGNPPDSCRCRERSREYAIKRRREALTAAVAALPRDELIEKAARALCDQGILALNGSEATWERHADGFRGMAEAVLVAVGLIPEHVTATEDPE